MSQIEPHFSSRLVAGLPFYGTDHPAISGLISDAGIQGQPVITAGRRAAGIRFRHFGNAGDGVSSRSQLCCVCDGIACAEGVYLPKVIIHAPVMVEWGSAALSHFCDRFAPPPLRTVRTPLDVHGSPSLLHLTKLFCHELACDNFRRPPMFSAVWQS